MHNDSKILEQFLKEWPIDRVNQMTIEEYTNSEKTSFCYWVEAKTVELGSIWGGSSYKFGIYLKHSSKIDRRQGYINDGTYAWVKKYGDAGDLDFSKLNGIP